MGPFFSVKPEGGRARWPWALTTHLSPFHHWRASAGPPAPADCSHSPQMGQVPVVVPASCDLRLSWAPHRTCPGFGRGLLGQSGRVGPPSFPPPHGAAPELRRDSRTPVFSQPQANGTAALPSDPPAGKGIRPASSDSGAAGDVAEATLGAPESLGGCTAFSQAG